MVDLEKILSHAKVVEVKQRTSFHLIAEAYRQFRRNCRKLRVKPSNVINAFLKAFNEKYDNIS